MSTDFPTSLDTFPSAATLAGENLDDSPHSTLHGNLGDAVRALEEKVGIDSSADTDSLDYKTTTAATAINDHLNDTTDAHDASAISVDSTDLAGTGTDVQTVLEELEDAIDGKVAASLFDAHTVLAATSDNTPAALTVSEETVVGRVTGGNIAAVNPSSVAQQINTQTDGYTLALSDRGKIVEINSSDPENLTVPPNDTIAFPVGSRVDVVQYGSGAVTLTPGDGVTIRVSAGLTLVTNGQYSGCTLYKRDTNEWVAIGDLVPA